MDKLQTNSGSLGRYPRNKIKLGLLNEAAPAAFFVFNEVERGDYDPFAKTKLHGLAYDRCCTHQL